MRTMPLTLGLVVLGAAWASPLPEIARQSFSAHMAMHMAVVALAAPLLTLALSGSKLDPVCARPRLFAPIPASIIELVVVWAWHTPALHHAARHETWALVLEQGSFLAAGLLLWMAAFGGRREQLRSRGGAGIAGLLFTSMHMTLLGALFVLSTRPLYAHIPNVPGGLSPLADQHLGGVIMLLVGGTSYLVGGLSLTARLLGGSATEQREVSSRCAR
jgi:putative membrane protein